MIIVIDVISDRRGCQWWEWWGLWWQCCRKFAISFSPWFLFQILLVIWIWFCFSRTNWRKSFPQSWKVPICYSQNQIYFSVTFAKDQVLKSNSFSKSLQHDQYNSGQLMPQMQQPNRQCSWSFQKMCLYIIHDGQETLCKYILASFHLHTLLHVALQQLKRNHYTAKDIAFEALIFS